MKTKNKLGNFIFMFFLVKRILFDEQKNYYCTYRQEFNITKIKRQ
jgi:hypothetical protein